jgi:predicted MFS family arabinose efflux permease
MLQEHNHSARPAPAVWGAIGSMTLCVALLIASEFMPVSLLTPIARELGATEGMAGQAISISACSRSRPAC